MLRDVARGPKAHLAQSATVTFPPWADVPYSAASCLGAGGGLARRAIFAHEAHAGIARRAVSQHTLALEAAITARAAQTNCTPSDPVEPPAIDRMPLSTTGNIRCDPHIPAGRMRNHHCHKTICSIRDALDIAVAIPEEIRPGYFQRWRRSARPWKNGVLLRARGRPARQCRARSLAASRTDDLRSRELQPEAGRIGKARPFSVRQNMRGEPAMRANVRDEVLLMLVEPRRVRHRAQ